MAELNGSLRFVGFTSLIRLIADTGKTGTLHLEQAGDGACVELENGAVVGAAYRTLRGMDALEAIVLALDSAEFDFRSEPPRGGHNVTLTGDEVQARLAQVTAQVSLFGRPLPPLDAVPRLTIASGASGCTGDVSGMAHASAASSPQEVLLDRQALATLLAVDGRRTIADIAADHGLVSTVGALVTLVEQGLVELPESPRPGDLGRYPDVHHPPASAVPPRVAMQHALPEQNTSVPAPSEPSAMLDPIVTPATAPSRWPVEPEPFESSPLPAPAPAAASALTTSPASVATHALAAEGQSDARHEAAERIFTQPEEHSPGEAPPGNEGPVDAPSGADYPSAVNAPSDAGTVPAATVSAATALATANGRIQPPGSASAGEAVPSPDSTVEAVRRIVAASAAGESVPGEKRGDKRALARRRLAAGGPRRRYEPSASAEDAATADGESEERPTLWRRPAAGVALVVVSGLILAWLLITARSADTQRRANAAAPGPSTTVEAGSDTTRSGASAAGTPGAAVAVTALPQALLDERFSSNERNWPNNPQSTAWFASDGTYHLMARTPGKFVSIGAPGLAPLRDVAVTAIFHKVGGPPGGGYGIILRDQDPGARDGVNQSGRFYVFEVSDRREVGIWRRDGDAWVDILPWTASSAVRPGSEPNQLAVLAADGRFTFKVNGTEVARQNDFTLTEGTAGIFLGGDGNEAIAERLVVVSAG